MRGETIQTFIDSGDRLEAWCHNPACNHHQRLDMIALREKLGPDHGSMHDDLVPLLYCSKCGGKKIGLIRQARGNDEKSMRGVHNHTNSYAKSKGR